MFYFETKLLDYKKFLQNRKTVHAWSAYEKKYAPATSPGQTSWDTN